MSIKQLKVFKAKVAAAKKEAQKRVACLTASEQKRMKETAKQFERKVQSSASSIR